MTPFMDSELNIFMHSHAGGLATFEFQDDNSNPRDMSEATIVFVTESFEKELTKVEGINHHMVLKLDVGDIPTGTNQEYVILDRTGQVTHALFEGRIVVRGW